MFNSLRALVVNVQKHPVRSQWAADAGKSTNLIAERHRAQANIERVDKGSPREDLDFQEQQQAALPSTSKLPVPPAQIDSNQAASPATCDTPPKHEDFNITYPTHLTSQARPVSSSRMGRLWSLSSLPVSLAFGSSESRTASIVRQLSQLRGAAMKIGQLVSIQDESVVSPEIADAFRQLQAQAVHMPDYQLDQVMTAAFGPAWETKFPGLDRIPFAAASIGQVHMTDDGKAVKVQYPDIQKSIQSDLSNMNVLAPLLPRGMFLGSITKAMKRELARECDYAREAKANVLYGQLLIDYKLNDIFQTPQVFPEQSSETVLTCQYLLGKPVGEMTSNSYSQSTRDWVAEQFMRLTLYEIFCFRFMQADPNFSNFLFNPTNERIGLLDFGAAQSYSAQFVDMYYKVFDAAVRLDKDDCKTSSIEIGYLSGQENPEMLRAHLYSLEELSSPFRHEGKFNFTNQTITTNVSAQIPKMLKHRQLPPPPETYSMNRKLSGAFLLCSKLRAKVDCSRIFAEVISSRRRLGMRKEDEFDLEIK